MVALVVACTGSAAYHAAVVLLLLPVLLLLYCCYTSAIPCSATAAIPALPVLESAINHWTKYLLQESWKAEVVLP